MDEKGGETEAREHSNGDLAQKLEEEKSAFKESENFANEVERDVNSCTGA